MHPRTRMNCSSIILSTWQLNQCLLLSNEEHQERISSDEQEEQYLTVPRRFTADYIPASIQGLRWRDHYFEGDNSVIAVFDTDYQMIDDFFNRALVDTNDRATNSAGITKIYASLAIFFFFDACFVASYGTESSKWESFSFPCSVFWLGPNGAT